MIENITWNLAQNYVLDFYLSMNTLTCIFTCPIRYQSRLLYDEGLWAAYMRFFGMKMDKILYSNKTLLNRSNLNHTELWNFESIWAKICLHNSCAIVNPFLSILYMFSLFIKLLCRYNANSQVHNIVNRCTCRQAHYTIHYTILDMKWIISFQFKPR